MTIRSLHADDVLYSFSAGAPPRTLVGAYSAPPALILAGLRGLTSKGQGRGGEGEKKGRGEGER